MNRIAARSTDLTERNRYFQSWYFNRTESYISILHASMDTVVAAGRVSRVSLQSR